MIKFQYLVVPYDPKKELVSQLNELCDTRPGFRFHSMGQEVQPTLDFKTGAPKVRIVLIMEFSEPIMYKPKADA